VQRRVPREIRVRRQFEPLLNVLPVALDRLRTQVEVTGDLLEADALADQVVIWRSRGESRAIFSSLPKLPAGTIA
jgi:hypothetical protein